MNNLLNSLGGEGFGGDLEYSQKKSYGPPLPIYKPWNPNPLGAPDAPRTPGIVMTTTTMVGETKEKSLEVTDKVNAVILYTSSNRQLASGKGANWSVKCSSDDGIKPSLRIDQPLCRNATSTDIARIFSTWKGMDKAKIDAKLAEVIDPATGTLTVCGLKGANGTIALCPYARKDPVTGNAGGCKPRRFVHAYDIDRKREFVMELTGKSDMYGQKFISPFHEFLMFLRGQGERDANGKPRGHPCYGYRVTLSATQDGNFYYLNVSNVKPIENDENIIEMAGKATAAKEAYKKKSERLSKEAYEKSKGAQAQGQTAASASTQGVTSAVAVSQPANPVGATPNASGTVADPLTTKAREAAVKLPPSFEDDDINF